MKEIEKQLKRIADLLEHDKVYSLISYESGYNIIHNRPITILKLEVMEKEWPK